MSFQTGLSGLNASSLQILTSLATTSLTQIQPDLRTRAVSLPDLCSGFSSSSSGGVGIGVEVAAISNT